MLKMNKKNKKAQVGSAIQELVGTIIVATIILLFIVVSPLFGFPSIDIEKVEGESTEQIYDHYFVMSRLEKQTSVAYGGKEHDMKCLDVVKLSYLDEAAVTVLAIQGLDTEVTEDSFYLEFDSGKIHVSKKEI
jgi:hypothetical protein